MKCKRFLNKVTYQGLLCGLLLAGAGTAGAASINILSATAPTPGPNDQYQTNYLAAAQSPPPGGGAFNYYLDANPSPGQTFTTGSNPTGYTINSVSLYDSDNSGGGFGTQTFTLGLYSVGGSAATLITTFTSQSVTLNDFTWFQWTNLSTVVLQPNTKYAYAMWRNGSGWCNLGSFASAPYTDGEVVRVPQGGGTMTFSSDPTWDAAFVVGLTPITAVTVGQATFDTGLSAVVPGTSVTATAAVSGPTPYFYQWRTDGGSGGALTNIPGANSSNLVINTASFTTGFYQYALFASNNTSSATGAVGVLQVQQPIAIPGVIGVKFAFTNGYATSDHLLPADNTGVPVVGNWNNLFADPNGAGSQSAAINQTWVVNNDSAGTPLANVTLTPFGFNDGWYSGGTGCAAGRLLYDCWKINQGGANPQYDGAGRLYCTLTFSNLSAAKYDVLVYVNNNNGNYWGNMQANNVVAQGGTDVDSGDHGFNGASADPCLLAVPLHTFGSYNGGNPANSCNYVKMSAVATTDGVIQIKVVSFGGGDMGLSGVQLVPVTLTKVQSLTPSYVESIPGQPLALSVSYSNTPSTGFNWFKVSGGVTNAYNSGITQATNNGVVSSTLSFGSLQLTDAGTYMVKVFSQVNTSEIVFSSAPVLVAANPAPINNVILQQEAQVGVGYYPPNWVADTSANLIYGSVLGDGSPGTVLPGSGNFGLDATSGDPTVLTDGVLGFDPRILSVTCGDVARNAGQSATYGLLTNSSPMGFEITNITVFGGWLDGGRRDQAYEILYSTVSQPTNFISLFTTQYLPSDPTGEPIGSRTKLMPANGVLAHNVAFIKVNWDVAQFLNGYSLYDEIEVNGSNSSGIYTPVFPVISSVMTVGTNLVVLGTGGTANANYTWFSTTNLTPPVVWSFVTQGVLSGSGALSNSIPMNSAEPTKFFQLRMP